MGGRVTAGVGQGDAVSAVAVVSVKASPGVSSIALGLAASMGPGSMLVEADLSGGSALATCPQLDPTGPTLDVALSSGNLTAGSQPVGEMSVVAIRGDVWRNTQAIAGVRRWRELWDTTAGPVVTDLGRWVPGSPTGRVAGEADTIVVVSSLDSHALAATLEWARRGGQLAASDAVLDQTRMVLVTTELTRTKAGKVSVKDLAADAPSFGLRYGGHVPFDEGPLDALRRGAGFGHKSVARSGFAAAIRTVVAATAVEGVAP